MLLRISCDDVRVGMFIHAIDGPWWRHPFWRARFLIENPADIATLRDSGVPGVTIDLSRGAGLEADAEEPQIERRMLDQPPPGVERRASRRAVKPRLISEVERAADTVARSKTAVTSMFREARLGRAIAPEEVAPLVQEISDSVARDASAMIKVTRLKTKNEYTYMHSVAVCALMINLGRHLKLSEDAIRDIGMAGLLHDIGKMSVPEAVLDKPGALDDAEFAIVRNHPEQGHSMLSASDVSAIALDVCLHHHERIDGKGYPFGLKDEEISLYARMGAICDVYDAVTSNRPYKRSWTPSEALARMLEWEGHFDRAILQAFIDSIGIHPVGAVVRLSSNRLALVTAANDAEPTQPIVCAFYSIPAAGFVEPQEVVLADGGERVTGGEVGEDWFGEHWPEVKALVGDGRTPPAALDPPTKVRAAREKTAAAA